MRRLPVIFGGFFVLSILAVAGAGFWVYAQFKQPGPLERSIPVVIKSGSSVTSIANELVNSGIIRDALIFQLAARYPKVNKGLQAGEFSIPARSSVLEILDILRFGKTIIHRITIAEGLSVYQVLDRLNAVVSLTGNVDTIPDEGTLLPETYHFSFGDSRRELIKRMRDDQQKTVSQLWANRDPDLFLKIPEKAVILASIVEKETGQSGERGRVAAVFYNRLKKGMRLQTDPTVVYGLTMGKHPLGRSLRMSELKKPTPYNTYIIKGLPPTPITNPGRASLKAVMNPPKTDELYFVANGQGGHLFAKTLKQHNRNVAKWRKIEKSRKP